MDIQMEEILNSYENVNIDKANFDTIKLALSNLKPESDFSLLKKAYNISKKIHKNQTRDEGTPYFIHPYRVALYLIYKMKISNEKMIAIALLHDTLEDGEDYSYKEMEEEFGVDIAAGVNVLTKPKITKRRTKAMQEILYKDRLLQGPKNSILVKLVDRLDNIKSIHLCPDKVKKRRYITETRETYLPLAIKYNSDIANEIQKRLIFLETGQKPIS